MTQEDTDKIIETDDREGVSVDENTEVIEDTEEQTDSIEVVCEEDAVDTDSEEITADTASDENDSDDETNENEEDAEDDIISNETISTVEALLFGSNSPLSTLKISKIAEISKKNAKIIIGILNTKYDESGNAFHIQEIAGGYQIMSRPEYYDTLKQLRKTKKDSGLSRPARETLAIIAYRQPILRADVEAIRGVASGELIRTLIEKKLVKITGRAEVIGRPMLYGTTKSFLDTFGLGDLNDLPRADELREKK